MDMATFTLSSGTINSLTRKSLPFLTKNTKPLFSLTLRASKSTLTAAASMSYDKELAAAKNAASLAARLCQKVQKALLQADVQSKSDKSPVTVADYGILI